MIVDADTHVIETDHTWEYMEGGDKRFRPQGIVAEGQDGQPVEHWLIDGHVLPRRQNIGQQTTVETREMVDVEARLRHMDDLGVDLHILYPTVFLEPLTKRPEVELALCRAYNRWLVDVCSKGKGRLKWVAILPLLSMDRAIEELRWAHAQGACGVFVRGMENEVPLWEPYYFPLYEELSRMDIPMGIHSGIGNFPVDEACAGESFRRFKLSVVGTFHSLLMEGIPRRFPKLRTGFVETGAQWVPYALHDLSRRLERKGLSLSRDVLRESNFYVAIQTDDDLDYVLTYAGEDNLIIGSDYGHSDNASELEALRRLRDKLPTGVVDKILGTNPARFYGFV
jgi:uncharacterized protein